ncbi:hypothetical protein Scep_028191 [Stephania cephalantha]|uniref:Uncharacterized protein n=1 Tax=Stephania cephalantha TaxID=152367 RepID=A0AAP0EHU2_9MAGN
MADGGPAARRSGAVTTEIAMAAAVVARPGTGQRDGAASDADSSSATPARQRRRGNGSDRQRRTSGDDAVNGALARYRPVGCAISSKSRRRDEEAVARDRVRDPVECTDWDSDLLMHRGKDMDMFPVGTGFHVPVWACGHPGTDSCYCHVSICCEDVALAYIDGWRQMVRSLLRGRGGVAEPTTVEKEIEVISKGLEEEPREEKARKTNLWCW